MKVKIYISFLITVLTNVFGYGQEYNKYCLYTDYAVKAYENGKYEKAIELMDSAINLCEEQNNDAPNWYNLSLFYKTLYKENNDINLRKKMLSSIMYAKGLDHENQLEKPISSYLKTIANLYRADAKNILEDTSTNFNGSIENYEEYKTISKLADSTITFEESDINFYNFFAKRNNTKFENNKTLFSNHADSAILYYKKSLALDSNQASTNLELGIIYFNQAVEIINKINPEAELQIVMAADERKADLALKGLPFFKRAFELSSENSDIIYALSGCYNILNFQKEKDFYLALLKEKDLEYYNSVMGQN